MKPDMQRARGFTLIELVIVMVLIGIMAALLSPLALSSLRAYDENRDDLVVLDKLRYATERLARETREVNYDSTTGFAFSSMGANSMGFTRAFYDISGTSSVAAVTVGNTVSAVTLQYSTPVVAAQVLTDELNGTAGLSFLYFMDDGVTQTIDQKLVRSVQISLTLLHNGNTYPQRTRVELKNILNP